ncbi:MAG: GMC family oxidoreductase N-terminal domain-containing protein [Rhodomicrobium sp.]
MTATAASTIPQRPLKAAHDYIVVGSGSGGAPVARRLVDAGASVLLIEAGPPGIGIPEIDDPAQWVPLGRSRYDWGYDYTPTHHVNGRTIGIPRGRVLGGSSAINAMMWYRGNPIDYDAWEMSGAEGWAFKDVLPYFKRCEDWTGGENSCRGAGGPLRIERSPSPHLIALAFMEAARELGVPTIEDPNGPNNEGASLSNFNISAGKRWNSARGYLWPILDNPNLTILTDCLAVSLGFEGNRCVLVRHARNGEYAETRANGEIVLALGAVDTPRLLMMSGIGDPVELKRLGIQVRAALPGVGQNLQDHPLVRAINFRSKKALGTTRDNGGGSMVNWKTSAGLSQANAHAFPVQGASATPALAAAYDLSGDIFAIGTGLMRSRSRGHLKLLGAEPGSPMEIQPNFLSDPEDLADLTDAAAFAMELGQAKAFSKWFGGFLAPEGRLSRTETAAFIRVACSTFFHICGTCKMGKDEMAVVDNELAVHGVEGLRIADASVIPVIPSCNTHAPVTMIGERAADFLLQSRLSKRQTTS